MRLRPPSPAMVVACLALAISLSGAAYAVSTALPRNSVGTVQLKNSAVNSAKVRNATLRAADFAPGQIPRGAQGPAGAAGPQGPPGVSGLQFISGSGPSNSTSPKSQQQDCPAGKRSIGAAPSSPARPPTRSSGPAGRPTPEPVGSRPGASRPVGTPAAGPCRPGLCAQRSGPSPARREEFLASSR
jgi:hypothetical protein